MQFCCLSAAQEQSTLHARGEQVLGAGRHPRCDPIGGPSALSTSLSMYVHPRRRPVSFAAGREMLPRRCWARPWTWTRGSAGLARA
ncbi:hypothetical protein BDZ91DRAFT_716617 [Kalaharituber pfeilii]|nr:hypothetical protein BDZ91DRAFT_716617 [Kalaharituber pfeilii]